MVVFPTQKPFFYESDKLIDSYKTVSLSYNLNYVLHTLHIEAIIKFYSSDRFGALPTR